VLVIIGVVSYFVWASSQANAQNSEQNTTQPVQPTQPDYSTKWTCLNGINVPVRLNSSGDVQCAATDGRNCLWGDSCNASTLPDNLKPLTCGSDHNSQWGGTGYSDKNHWCNKVFRTIKTPDTPQPKDLV